MPRKTEEFSVKATKRWKLNTTSIPRFDPQFIKDTIITVSIIRTECVNVMMVIYYVLVF